MSGPLYQTQSLFDTHGELKGLLVETSKGAGRQSAPKRNICQGMAVRLTGRASQRGVATMKGFRGDF